MSRFQVFIVKDESWLVEFLSEDEARRALEHFNRTVREMGREEAELWVEDIVEKYGGRIIDVIK